MMFRRIAAFSALAVIAGLAAAQADQHVDWIALGDRQVPILSEDSALTQAARMAQTNWPTLRDALDDDGVNWINSHPARDQPHGEVRGFGLTVVRWDAERRPLPLPRDFVMSEGDLMAPTLLFYDRSRGLGPRRWPLIGIGYAFDFTDFDGDGVSDPPAVFPQNGAPRLDLAPREAFLFNRDGMLIHEAGYHIVAQARPGFQIVRQRDIRRRFREAGLVVDLNGESPINWNHLERRPPRFRHGRLWVLHAFFDPASGRPTISPCDPWGRSRPLAARLPLRAFYYRDRPDSPGLVRDHCNEGGVYPTIADQAPNP